jgi:5-carboxymethyl-2-hydroxymuconate isomerase
VHINGQNLPTLKQIPSKPRQRCLKPHIQGYNIAALTMANFSHWEHSMPHMIMEYSSNLIEKNNLNDLFAKINPILAQTLVTDISGCKCRGLEYADYHIGLGDAEKAEQAFVHMELKVLRGRDPGTLHDMGIQLMDVSRDFLAESFKKLYTQMTLEIVELSPQYFKFSSNSPKVKVFSSKADS